MKKIIPIVVISLLISSCSSPSEKVNVDFQEIHKSISKSISSILTKLQTEFEYNNYKWFDSYEKSLYINAISDSIISSIELIEANELLAKSFCNEFMESYENIHLQDSILDNLIKNRLQHWITGSKETKNKYSLILDIRLCTLDILNSLFINSTNNDYAVNVMRPVIMDSGNTVKRGEMYTAKIGLLGYDSTYVPTVYLDENYLEVMSGYGIYRATYSTPGKKTFSGKITYPRKNHEIDTFYYEGAFYVE